MDPFVDGSLEWESLALDDLGGIADLREAIEYLDDPVETVGLEELEHQWHTSESDPTLDGVVGRDKGGTIVAYGWNLVRNTTSEQPLVWLDGGVHPAWRHRSIGRHLLQWQTSRVREWQADRARAGQPQSVWAGRYVDSRQPRLAGMMTRQGYLPQRWYFDMHLDLVDGEGHPLQLPTPGLTAGVQLTPYHPELDEQVRLAHNECFAAETGAHRVSRDTWQAWMRREASRPQWSWVAICDEKVVGYALNSLDVDGGWTDRLGVLPEVRERGLGRSLLLASMRSFLQAGLVGAGLGVNTDSPDHVHRLMESVGYVSQDTVVLHGQQFGIEGLAG